jgi:regulator of protease activity HflC (stomatin/prohibitin superfamily)
VTNTPLEIAAGIGVELIIFGIGLGVLYRLFGKFLPLPTRLIVPPFQCGVVLRHDKVERILVPGAYWLGPARTMLLCDTRPIPFRLDSQEILTSQGLALRIGVSGEYRIVSPEAFITTSSNSAATFFLEARQALRASVTEIATDDSWHTTLADLPTRIKELLTPRASQLGIEIMLLELSEAVPLGRFQGA